MMGDIISLTFHTCRLSTCHGDGAHDRMEKPSTGSTGYSFITHACALVHRGRESRRVLCAHEAWSVHHPQSASSSWKGQTIRRSHFIRSKWRHYGASGPASSLFTRGQRVARKATEICRADLEHPKLDADVYTGSPG